MNHKIFPTSLLVLLLLSSSAVVGADKTREERLGPWKNTDAQIVPRDILFTEDFSQAYKTEAAGPTNNTIYKLVPTGEGDANGARRRRKLQDNTEISPSEGSVHGADEKVTPFVVEVKDPELKDLAIVLDSDDPEEPPSKISTKTVDGVVDEKLGGLAPGTYTWHVEGVDESGTTVAASEPVTFDVLPPNSGTLVGQASWPYGGQIQEASGRIYFRIPSLGYYMCSGTAIKDHKTGRSLVLTAAHCVFDWDTLGT
jgi:hypothetical protein